MKSYKHKVLVANPAITDPIFAGSIVFLFDHDRKGAQGVILNPKNVKKLGFAHLDGNPSEEEAMNEVKNMFTGKNPENKLQTAPLYIGGPCRTPGMYFLHGYEEFCNPFEEKSEFDLGIPESFEIHGDDEPAYEDDFPGVMPSSADANVIDGVYFGTPMTFMQIIESGRQDENRFRFFIGQANWSGGQLDEEVAGGAWSVREATSDLFFDEDAQKQLLAEVSLAEASKETEDEKPAAKEDYWPWSSHPKPPKGFDSLRN